MQLTRYLLRLNAFTCIAFGTVFFLFAPSVSSFLGGFPTLWLNALGVGLSLHGVHLALGSYRNTLLKFELCYFSIGDILWFLGSLLLLLSDTLISSREGVIATVLVAVMVLMIGVAQLLTYLQAVETNFSKISK